MYKPFSQPAAYLSETSTGTLAQALATLSDVAIIINRKGIIKDVAGDSGQLDRVGAGDWCGRRLDQVVDLPSIAELRALMTAEPGTEGPRARVVQHATGQGGSVSIRYAAVSTGKKSAIMLLGRRVGNAAENGSAAGEPSPRRLGGSPLRGGPEALVLVDAPTGKVRGLNEAAAALLGREVRRPAGRRFETLFARADRVAVAALLAEVASTAAPGSLQVRLDRSGHEVTVTALPETAGQGASLAIRLDLPGGARPADNPEQSLVMLARAASEGIVLTDEAGRIFWGNDSFVELLEGGTLAEATGRALGDFFDAAELDIDIALANVRRRGRVKLLAASLRGPTGRTTPVELSIVPLPKAFPSGFGIVMRDVGLRLDGPDAAVERASSSGRAAESLIGKVSLQELVRDEVDAIEKSCIEAALVLTGNNRAATARILGLSRQSLYMKMRRHDLLTVTLQA